MSTISSTPPPTVNHQEIAQRKQAEFEQMEKISAKREAMAEEIQAKGIERREQKQKAIQGGINVYA